MSKTSTAGFGLVDILLASVVLTAVVLLLLQTYTTMSRSSVRSMDRSFASQKTIQMMEELRSLVVSQSTMSINTLDSYDDGIVPNFKLTTKNEVTDPADPLSGNTGLRYARLINIVSLTNDPLAREVHIRILSEPSGDLLAETMSVLRTLSNQYLPIQVFDIYFIAIENAQAVWLMPSLKPTALSLVQDLLSRNPGLQFRTHWITRLAYGRDPFYKPYLSAAHALSDAPFPYPWVYLYLGAAWRAADGTPQYDFNEPDMVLGRLNVDDQPRSEPFDYALADQFNHAVREPDEETVYNQHVQALSNAGLPAPEISLRMLLDRMNDGNRASGTSALQDRGNILIVNLHSGALAMPPLRNYSDPAKDPDTLPYARVVTHPQLLEYPSGSQVDLRVYAYVAMNPDNYSVNPDTPVVPTITVLISTPLACANITAQEMTGNSTSNYSWKIPTIQGGDYFCDNISVPGSVKITLPNTPLRQPLAPNGTGLAAAAAARLYGLEYIPCQVDLWNGGPPFNIGTPTPDLSTGGNGPKNTARWIITIPPAILADGQYTVETRIGADITTGVMNVPTSQFGTNKAADLSRTWFWVGTPAPETERYQFIGDPRHVPYADVKRDHRYNWYFNAAAGSVNGGGYSGFTKWTAGGWVNTPGYALNVDVPRYFQILREGLLNTNSLWANILANPFMLLNLGGNIASGAGGWNFTGAPWNGNNAAAIAVDEDLGSGAINGGRLIGLPGGWTSMPWIGELFPDADWLTWKTNGNLPTTGNILVPTYRRLPFNSATLAGLSANAPYTITGGGATTADPAKGIASFINGSANGDNGHFFYVASPDTVNTGALTGPVSNPGPGQEMISMLNSVLPQQMQASGPSPLGPFEINSGNAAPSRPMEWLDPEYSSKRTVVHWLEPVPYYTTPKGAAWSLASVTAVASGTTSGFYFSNTGSYTFSSGTNNSAFNQYQLVKLGITTLLRGFMVAGLPIVSPTAYRVPQLPLVTITQPVDSMQTVSAPANIAWSVAWNRWDGQAYTSDPAYASFIDPDSTFWINLIYSKDNGKTWQFMGDNTAAVPGVASLPEAIATNPYPWDLSSATLFPQGSYLIRVEVFRQDRPSSHYAYHQKSLFIQRS